MAALPASPAGFSLTINGVYNPITEAGLNINKAIVELTMTRAISAKDINIKLSYTTGTVKAADGGVLAGFSNTPVKNNLPAALLARWNFDEGMGTTLRDVTGNGNEGTIAGAGWVNGKIGGALSFDGKNDYVAIPYKLNLDIRKALTAEAWINPSSNKAYQRIIAQAEYPNKDYSIYLGDKNNIIFSANIGGVVNNLYSAINSLPVGTWSHVAGTYDGEYIRLYLNGKQVAFSKITGEINSDYKTMTIGGDPKGYYFSGMIDEVGIYNSALTAENILSRYQGAPKASK
jgi:hypothetical protein